MMRLPNQLKLKKQDYKIKKEIEKTIKNNILVIVEGKKDKLALEKIGFKKIFVLFSVRPFFISLEKILNLIKKNNIKECVILTDFDKKGKLLYDKIKRELSKEVRINNKLRFLLSKKISHIEGINNLFFNDY